MKEHFKHMSTVVCECGKEILIIPDLKEMANCIEEHAKLHVQNEIDPSKKQAEHDRIEEQLTKKIIIKIAKASNIGSRQSSV